MEGGSAKEIGYAFLAGGIEGAALTLGVLTGAEIAGVGLATTIEAGSVAGGIWGELGGLTVASALHSADIPEQIATPPDEGQPNSSPIIPVSHWTPPAPTVCK